MCRVSHILKELGHNLYRNPATALGSLMSLTLLFLLFDLFWVAAGTSERFYTRLLADMQMEVFVAEETPESSLDALNRSLEAIEGVRAVAFISREMARERLTSMLGADLLVGYDTANPLPSSYVLSFDPGYLNCADMTRVENEMAYIAGVDQVYYSKRWLAKAEQTRTIILNVGMALGVLILLTALTSSANNIRLMIQTRAVGLRRMRILGAGRLFLATPFLLEGLLVGGLSAGIGWAVIFYARQEVTFTQFELVAPSLQEVGIFCAATALLGLTSGYLGIRKMLR